jgi:signal transduction histidine kinase/CheY-like chemotaxis protein
MRGEEPVSGVPMVMHFGPRDYRAHPINHAIQQSANGILYVANEQGILEFDGRNWERIGESHIVYDLDIDDRGRIWTSGYRRFGWMELDSNLQWKQQNLYLETERFGSVESEFRNVECGVDAVYFAAHNSLYRYRESDGLQKLLEGHYIRNLHRIGSEVFVVGADSNFHKITEDGIERVLKDEVFWGPNLIRASGVLSGNRLAFMTVENGLWIWDGEALVNYPALAAYFPEHVQITGISDANDGSLLIATAGHGFWSCSLDGSSASPIRLGSSSTIHSLRALFEDRNGDFWLCHERGITAIRIPLLSLFYGEESGLRGVVNEVYIHENSLYAGTSLAAYEASLAPETGAPYQLAWKHLGFHHSCRSFAACVEAMFFGTASGLYRKEGETITRMGWTDQSIVLNSSQNPNRIYAGGYEGLWSVEQKGDGWTELKHVLPEKGIVHGFGEASDGTLWIRMGEGRVGRMPYDPETKELLPLQVLGTSEGLAPWWINPLIVGNRVFASGNHGLMEYDAQQGRFLESKEVSYFPGEGPFFFSQELLLEDGSSWVTRNDAIANLIPYPQQSPAAPLHFYSETIESRANAVTVHPLLDAYATVNGVILVMGDSGNKKQPMEPRLILRSVTDLKSNQILASNLISGVEATSLTLPSQIRDLRFRFVLDSYWDAHDHTFQFFLEGFDDEWIHFESQSEKSYANLKPGRYTFMVRGRDRELLESDYIYFHFRILSPWYLTYWAYAGYLLMISALVYAGILIREARLRRTNKYLQVEVSLRTREVLFKATELERKNLELQAALIQSTQLQKEALAASITKGRFLATMSHEIRTPMNGVIGMCELMQHTRIDSYQGSLLRTIKRSSESLLSILNGILDFSKIESGTLQVERIPTCIRTCAEEVLELLAYDVHLKRIGLWLNCDPALAPMRIADPTRLRQVLINLVGNAVKFTDRGEVCLRIQQNPSNKNPESVLFSVIDTGIGISPENQNLLFQPFTQVDDSNLRRHGGTGLGLSISKSLVEMMGGTLSCKSEPGFGSEFSFELTLPVVETDRVADSGSPKRICCLAASQCAEHSLRSMMESLGQSADVFRIDSPDLAILLRNNPAWELILFDWEPEITPNLELTLKAIRSHENTRGLPILVLTWEVAPTCTSPKVAFTHKPVRIQQLRERIDSCDSIQLNQPNEQEPPKTGDPKNLEWEGPIAENSLLLVEDNPVNQKVAGLLLKRLGFQVELAQDGVEAIEKIQAKRFSLVVMDIQMPRMDGIEATQWIRNNIAADRQPAIIAMTAGVTQLDRKVCSDAGMDGFVEKPVRIDALKQEMGRVIASISNPPISTESQ